MNESEPSHELPVEEAAAESSRHERYREGAPLSRAIDAWQSKRSEEKYRKVAAASAAISREKYREEREAQGLTVRPYVYHEHDPQKFGESREEYEKRLHRDRARARRGVTEQTVRTWTDLSNLTEEEKADHRKRQARDRKANERKRKAELKLTDGYDSNPDFGMF